MVQDIGDDVCYASAMPLLLSFDDVDSHV